MVKRLFVEKKPGFDVEARHLKKDLCQSGLLSEQACLRLFNRYDIEGLDNGQLAAAKDIIFSEPNVDSLYSDELNLPDSFRVVITEYLPGQYDQRADSAAQCAALLTGGERPLVATARVIAIDSISETEAEAIAKYVINPVESRRASALLPKTLKMQLVPPEKTERVIGFINLSDAEIDVYHKDMGFAMTAADLCFCREHFKQEGRDPSITELKVIDTYWSDHCRHTTFLTELTSINVVPGQMADEITSAIAEYYAARTELYGEREKTVCLMDMATMGGKLLYKRGLVNDLDISEEINACSIEATVHIDGQPEQWLIQFKNETHNHPTEIEPFGGAATCLGGAIRDPLSGRAFVYAAMRVTGSGDPTVPLSETLEGKLPARIITTGAAAGYSSYGNQIGLATGQVSEIYDPGYTAKRMEIGAVVGASPKKNVIRDVPAPGDIIVLLGGRTGRDGCGGATGSSKAHTTESTSTCGAEVQKGNPPTERKLQRLFRDERAAGMIKRCNDFGAGGVCVAIGELAPGLSINLDNVPKKYEGLSGTELAISESQERMAVVLSPGDVSAFIALAAKENLEATPVAEVTAEPILKMIWQDDAIVDLPRAFLDTNGVTGKQAATIDPPKGESPMFVIPEEINGKTPEAAMLANIARLNVCSQQGLGERFDASIGAASVLMPFAGKHQITPEQGMVMKIPVGNGETDDATAFTFGFSPALSRWSPFAGAQFAVIESLSKLLCLGANPLNARLTFQEYFLRLKDDPSRWGQPAAALLGALRAQMALGVPSIGGKDSMSGSFDELDVPPTLVSFALCMTSAQHTLSAAAHKDKKLALVRMPLRGNLPDYEATKRLYNSIGNLISAGHVTAAAAVGEGGASATALKMAMGEHLGINFIAKDAVDLYAPLYGSLVLEANDWNVFSGIEYTQLAETIGDGQITIMGQTTNIDKVIAAYNGTLERVFPQNSATEVAMQDVPLFTERNLNKPTATIAKPSALIMVFPGTNSEIDSARAFARAGAEPNLLVVKNLTPEGIEETIQEMVKRINAAQIIMLPGGFSAGDEPDGSGKFIATTFRNQYVKEATMNMLNKRDGLMLGICNGFQALIKLGLVPYGEIRTQKPNDPTLTFNSLGRHVSRMVYTRVSSVKSPWLSLCQPGDIHAVPISHGEGRFVADDETIARLAQNGQIAFQHVNLSGTPSADIAFNPNGSMSAIEGITSPDGRILGKMGHSERMDKNCYKNVPGEKDQKIFQSGVNYFK